MWFIQHSLKFENYISILAHLKNAYIARNMIKFIVFLRMIYQMNYSIFQDRGFIYIFWLYCGQGNAIVISLSTIISAFHIPKLFLAFYKN